MEAHAGTDRKLVCSPLSPFAPRKGENYADFLSVLSRSERQQSRSDKFAITDGFDPVGSPGGFLVVRDHQHRSALLGECCEMP